MGSSGEARGAGGVSSCEARRSLSKPSPRAAVAQKPPKTTCKQDETEDPKGDVDQLMEKANCVSGKISTDGITVNM